MTTLGDLYVDVHANTKPLRQAKFDREGDAAGKQFAKGFEKSTDRAMGKFEKDFKSSIAKALDNLPDLDINASEANKKVAGLKGELRALSDLEIGVDIDAAGALAHLGLIRTALEALTKDANIDLDIGTGAGGALGAITSMTNLLPQFATEGAKAGGVMAMLGSTAARVGPLIGVLAAGLLLLVGAAAAAGGALGGLALALGAPLGAALGGGGLFAFLAGKYIGETNKVIKQIEKLKEEGKTGEANALIAQLSTAQTAYMKARNGLTKAFDKFIDRNDASLLAPFTAGLELLTPLMKSLDPLIKAVSVSITSFIKSISPTALTGIIGSMTKMVTEGKVLDNIFGSLKSVGSIFSTIFGAGADLGVSALEGMSNALQRFANYLKGAEGQKQLKEFFDWVQTHGPEIGRNLLDFGAGIYNIVKALTPAGEAVLVFLGAWGKLTPVLGPVVKLIMGGVVVALAAVTGAIGLVIGALGLLVKGFSLIPGAPEGTKRHADAMLNLSKQTLTAADEMGKLGIGLDEVGKKKPSPEVKPKINKPDKDKVDAALRAFSLGIYPTVSPVKGKDADKNVTAWKNSWGNPFTMTFNLKATISATAQKIMDFVKNFGWIGGKGSWGGAGGLRLPPGFASGGKVPGRTPSNKGFDNVAAISRKGNPLRVQSGEWIINSRMSKKNDRLLAAINAGFDAQKTYRFSGGGIAPVPRKHYASGGQVAPVNESITNVTYAPTFAGPTTGPAQLREFDWIVRHIPVTGAGVSVVA